MSETKVFTGMSDASGAVALDENTFIVANDEDNILRIYDLNDPGQIGLTYLSKVFKGEISDDDKREIDIEGAARLGDKIFWIGSHSANKNGKPRPDRHCLFAIRLASVENGKFAAEPVGQIYRTLISDLEADERFDVYQFDKARTIAPKDIGALSIEGLTTTPDGTLLIGFRNPLAGGQKDGEFLVGGKALVIKLLNPLAVIEGRRARFDAPVELDLGGFGIRNIEYFEARDAYLIVGGPYHDNEETATHPRETGRLYLWSGNPDDDPKLLDCADLTGLNIEAAFFLPQTEDRIALLSDDGSLENEGFRLTSFDLGECL